MRLLSSIQACKTRAILTAEQAIEILKIKLASKTDSRSRYESLSPCCVARAFGVSEKAVRDIWKGRTWLRETMHLDPARVVMAARLRPPGRPPRQPHQNPQCIKSSTLLVSVRTGLKRSFGHLDDKEGQCISILPLPHKGTASSSPVAGLLGNDPAWRETVQLPVPPDGYCSCTLPNAVWTDSSLGSALLHGDLWLSSAAEAAPLPESSRADDPFHDDWPYWPKEEDGGTVRPACEG